MSAKKAKPKVEAEAAAWDPHVTKIFTDTFKAVDADHDGVIDRQEFEKFLKECGQARLARHMFDVVDNNGDGKISLEEFLQFGAAMTDMANKLDLTKYLSLVFDCCDVGRKGRLTRSEFSKFLECIGADEEKLGKDKVFDEWDRDQNGTIEFEEILAKVDFVLKVIRKA
jgi:Ca2+-binding EF-hand superfamily protein